jgi:hypothetical protein
MLRRLVAGGLGAPTSPCGEPSRAAEDLPQGWYQGKWITSLTAGPREVDHLPCWYRAKLAVSSVELPPVEVVDGKEWVSVRQLGCCSMVGGVG